MSKNTDTKPSDEIAFFNRKTPLGDKTSGSVSFIGIDGYYYAVCEGKLYFHCANVGAIIYAVSHGCQCFLSDDHVFLLAADAIDLTNKRDPPGHQHTHWSRASSCPSSARQIYSSCQIYTKSCTFSTSA